MSTATPPAGPEASAASKDGRGRPSDPASTVASARVPETIGPPPVAPPRQLPPPPRIDDERRQLPPHRGKLTRIQDSVEGAVLGLRDWMELRVELAKAEVQETLDEKKEQIKWGGAGAGVGFFGVIILLLTIGFGFSALFRALFNMAQLPALTAGYGLLALILLLIAAVLLRKARGVSRPE